MQSDNPVMIVTDVFPPVAAVGVYRTAALCRHLVEHGHPVTVVTARPWADELLDPEMLSLVPREVRVVATSSPNLPLTAARLLRRRPKRAADAGQQAKPQTPAAAPAKSRRRLAIDWLSWWMHVPDARTGWLLPAVSAGLREARRRRPCVVYCTAPGWTSHLAGLALSHLLRVPLVADFQDPWCGSYWRRIPYGAQRRLDEWLEKMVVRRASRITCCWDGIRRHLEERYPARRGELCTILNGFSSDEIDGIEPERLDERRCVLLHAGNFYGPRRPEPLFDALQRLRAESPGAAEELSVVLVGRPQYAGRAMQDIVREHGVEDFVKIIPPVSRQKALALTRGASVALLFGQSGFEQLASVPAKTYDYVGYGLPVLAIGGGDEVCGIIRDGGCRLWRTNDNDAQGILAALREIVRAHRDQRLAPSRDERRMAFAWPALAARLAEVVLSASKQGMSKRCKYGS
jgi:glycosyltransferase involved in cell wall biosynthesis